MRRIISDTQVRISKIQKINAQRISSKLPFFNERVTYHFENGCLVFRIATIDDTKTIKPYIANGLYTFDIYGQEVIDGMIPHGLYEPEGDSTEDELIINYKSI